MDYTEFTVAKEFLSQYRYTAVLHLKNLAQAVFEYSVPNLEEEFS